MKAIWLEEVGGQTEPEEMFDSIHWGGHGNSHTNLHFGFTMHIREPALSHVFTLLIK